ncbi:unnamed protein product [Pleuronectes platessa]|uniref:RING-type domain-containing protein n=1 Tax=Pleuronectes platessa TaxID=8262 RepID=A0A9N7YKL3_PLEPL|nr:unnamed protein product [Pleuronectes platessa]
MAARISCPQIRCRELDVGKAEGEEDSFQSVSRCPACNQDYDVALILPCSHTMCGQCVAAGERTSSGQSLHRHVGLSACSVLCPSCRHPVELPCGTWSSATSCLPKHPSLSPARVRRETGTMEGASEDPLHHVQVNLLCSLSLFEPGSNAASSPIPPVDGDVDLREEEMEQSVFGLCFALDPSSVPPSLLLSNGSLTATYRGPATPPPGNKMTSDPTVPLDLPQVCADVVIARGQYYWEVDVCNSSLYRIGVISLDGCRGWWLERQGLSFWAVYDGSWEPLYTVPPQIKSLGIFLNIGGGALSFHNPLTHEHLATLATLLQHRWGAPGSGPGPGPPEAALRSASSSPRLPQ